MEEYKIANEKCLKSIFVLFRNIMLVKFYKFTKFKLLFFALWTSISLSLHQNLTSDDEVINKDTSASEDDVPF